VFLSDGPELSSGPFFACDAKNSFSKSENHTEWAQ
jgi:hypothetical protein